MGNLKIRRCPRCNRGEIFIDRDHYGWFECCLQCGYTRDLPDIIRPEPARNANTAGAAATIKKNRPRLRPKKA